MKAFSDLAGPSLEKLKTEIYDRLEIPLQHCSSDLAAEG
jgi:hypothetical protein